jgi:hypothetical protein
MLIWAVRGDGGGSAAAPLSESWPLAGELLVPNPESTSPECGCVVFVPPASRTCPLASNDTNRFGRRWCEDEFDDEDEPGELLGGGLERPVA